MSEGFRIGQRVLAPDKPPYVAAEIGVNHNGDLALARRTIDAAVAAGVDAVKFQTFRAEEFMADPDHIYEYTSEGKPVRESMFEMFKRLELPGSWHAELKSYAEAKGVGFLSSAADPLSADLLKELGVPVLKLASEDLINHPLLAHCAATGLPLILSTGMGTEREIERALEVVTREGAKEILLLHCVSLYPTPDDEANLLRMQALRERFGLPVGYSDHTRGIDAALGATVLGAVFIEKHFTLDRGLPGPDHVFSSDPQELAALVAGVKRVAAMRGAGGLGFSPSEEEARNSFRRSIVARNSIPAGTVLTREQLHLKRPGTGISPLDMDKVLGKVVRVELTENEQLAWDMLAETTKQEKQA